MTGLRGKLLIVDDNAANLRAFTAILEPLGAEIMTVTSGEEALRVLLREELALILLDVQMPGMDGYETAGLIRARERSRHIPIIFLTALPRDDRFVARGYELGAVDFIVKPVDAQILRSKAQVFLELHEKTQIIRQQTEQLRRASEQKLIDYQRWSEQRYVSLADAMPELVWTADADGVLLFKNRHWALCAGSESTNLDFSDIVHPEDMPMLSAAVQAARAEGRDWELEARFGNPRTGEYRWHLARAVPTRGPDGEVTGWVGSSRDIDARRRAKHALEMLAALSRRLAELSQGLSGLDQVLQLALPILGDAAVLEVRGPGGTVERISSSLPDVSVPELGDPRLDFGPSTVVFTGEPEVILDVERELAEPSKRSSDHARFLSEIGVASYVCVPLVVRERVFGAVAFFTSGSRRHYAETELRLIEDVAGRLATGIDNLQLYAMAERERKKLEEAGKAKDVFLATLSHELRTPLNAIVGWSHLLRGGLEPAQSARAIETIDRNARSLAKLVGDLIDVSRIVSGNLKVEERPIDFRQVVEAAVDALRPSADSGGIELELALDTERAARVVGDATRLQQVSSNILANAIKFTPKGGRIQVALETRNELLTLSVKDTGHGIATEFLPFVFEPFRQGRRTHARSQEGLGLGLAIVKHLVELHGGSVRAESEGTGHGTTIVVSLPLAAPPSSSDSRDPGAVAVSPSEPPPPQSDQDALLSGVHALVVEDDPDGCELLETVLKSFGAKVTTASTARDAYTALCAERPDVLVSDIGLPDEDGLALIRRVRETEGLAGLPAVALTAYASKRDVAQALAAGFQAHVAKPVAPQELGTTIARVSGR